MAQQQEFQVIILAGGTGSRMYPLTEEIPKYLLPVANRPLITYQLELLEKAGFQDVIIITTESNNNSKTSMDLRRYVAEVKGKLTVTFEIVEPDIGTAQALAKIRRKLRHDFMVISGDLIVEEHFLHGMADMHRSRDAAVTVLLRKEVIAPETVQAKKKDDATSNEGDFIGLFEDDRIVLFAAVADLDDTLDVNKSVLKRYPNVTLHSDLVDAHFYIFSRWVLDCLEKYDGITSIKGEFIPFLVKLQKRKKLARGGNPPSNTSSLVSKMTSTRKHESDSLGCFAYIVDEGYCQRVNTIHSYMQANAKLSTGKLKYLPWEHPGKNNFIHETAQIEPQTAVGPECIVGQSTIIGSKSSVKKSCIGKHCKIGDNVKITNSIIMDYVTIEKGYFQLES
eukprot:TRINITY_DN3292_c0_g1_i2.p1 TRINITY_DN3292_c0_g1~~TRINITY_DN3292_c0_g1_i2.p1  ORF type:complete len:394 (+),score=91.81 TRINITY_DN3292_c0_g1_i2:14-1195(+)